MRLGRYKYVIFSDAQELNISLHPGITPGRLRRPEKEILLVQDAREQTQVDVVPGKLSNCPTLSGLIIMLSLETLVLAKRQQDYKK